GPRRPLRRPHHRHRALPILRRPTASTTSPAGAGEADPSLDREAEGAVQRRQSRAVRDGPRQAASRPSISRAIYLVH
uniref:Uncharacterized protein n=1 Tax=Oryza brachyantha TaxID=4533 RepID=J3MI03_ORYBR